MGNVHFLQLTKRNAAAWDKTTLITPTLLSFIKAEGTCCPDQR